MHKIPEGLAIALVLVPRGIGVRAAAGWSVVSALPVRLLALPAYAVVSRSDALLPLGVGFAAGAMILLVACELLPEALDRSPRRAVALAAGVAFALMAGIQALFL